MKKILSVFLLLTVTTLGFALSPEKVMSRIDRKAKRADHCKCLSKTIELNGATVKFFYTKKKKLVKIIEKKTIDGVAVFRYFYFDKKTETLMSVNLVETIFYYYDSDYFAVISRGNFSEAEAEKRGADLKQIVTEYRKEKI